MIDRNAFSRKQRVPCVRSGETFENKLGNCSPGILEESALLLTSRCNFTVTCG